MLGRAWKAAGLGCGLLTLAGLSACASDDAEPTGAMSYDEADLVECMPGAMEPCKSYEDPDGAQFELSASGSVMEANVGIGFETDLAAGDADGGATCSGFALIFGQDAETTATLLDTMDLDFALFTVYRPAILEEGKKYPLLTWGNGTCAQPEGYGTLLRYVASEGFIVVAANSRWVGGNEAMTKALDFMFAANEDESSPYYGLIDTDKVGAMGHSQGSGATRAASSDERIKSVILFNGGTSANKPFLAISGDRDIGMPTVDSYATGADGADQPGAYLFFHEVPKSGNLDGHLTLMTQPERVTDLTVNWFRYTLEDDADAKAQFVGDDCGLCGEMDAFEYGANSMLD